MVLTRSVSAKFRSRAGFSNHTDSSSNSPKKCSVAEHGSHHGTHGLASRSRASTAEGPRANPLLDVHILAGSAGLQDALFRAGYASDCYAGQVILGDETEHEASLIVVLTGLVHVFIGEYPNGLCVETLAQGKYFGECELLGFEDRRCYTLTSEGESSVFRLTRTAFLKTLESFRDDKVFFESIFTKNKVALLHGTLKRPLGLFRGLHPDAVNDIHESMTRRLYAPGAAILTQGDTGEHICIVAKGQVSVEINGLVVREDEPSEEGFSRRMSHAMHSQEPPVFGELNFQGLATNRTATVKARSLCQVRILHRSVFQAVLDKHGIVRPRNLVDGILEAAEAEPIAHDWIKNVKTFQEVECSDEFLEFLEQHVEDVVAAPGQVLCEQGTSDDRSMYVVASGKVKVIKDDALVGHMQTGEAFGELMILGFVAKRSVTVIAETVVHLKRLDSSVMITGLKQYPDDRLKLLRRCLRQGVTFKEGSAGQDNLQVIAAQALASSEVFHGLPEARIQQLSSVAVERVYMPGDIVIQQGSKSRSLFIMIVGQASVFTETETSDTSGDGLQRQNPRGDDNVSSRVTRNTIGELSAGACVGEMSMLGIYESRSTTIMAVTVCFLWELEADAIMPIVDQHADMKALFANTVKRSHMNAVQPIIEGLRLFSDFGAQFRSLLSLYSDRRVYFPGHRVFQEDAPGEGLAVVTLGQASITRRGVHIAFCAVGSYYNSVLMLGLAKKSLCTMLAVQLCHVVIISRTTYYLVLGQSHCRRIAKTLERTEQDLFDDFRSSVQRLCVYKRLQDRYEEEALASTVGPLGDVLLISNRVLRLHVLRSWRDAARASLQSRQVRERQEKETRDWIDRRKDHVERRRRTDRARALARGECASSSSESEKDVQQGLPPPHRLGDSSKFGATSREDPLVLGRSTADSMGAQRRDQSTQPLRDRLPAICSVYKRQGPRVARNRRAKSARTTRDPRALDAGGGQQAALGNATAAPVMSARG